MADEDFLPVTAGDTLTVRLEFDEPVDPEVPDGARQPTDMSAWTFASQWRPTESSTRVIAFSVNQSQANVGVVILTMTGTQTATMLENGVYDVQGTNGAAVETFWKEQTRLTLDVTRG